MKPYVDLFKLREVLLAQLDKPYRFGHEVKRTDIEPLMFDCSELVEWGFAQVNVTVPDGSYNQFDASTPVKGPALFGDLVFLKRPDNGPVYHVGVVLNDVYIIEARGNPKNKVCLIPRKDWEAHPNFAGYRRLNVIKD